MVVTSVMAKEEEKGKAIARDLCADDSAELFGLEVSLKKTEVLNQAAPQEVFHHPHITIGESELKSVQQFTYLGSIISSDGKIDKGIDNSIEAMLLRTQVRWAGHISRMEDHRLPKIVLYGELATSCCKRETPVLG
ncbi:hypothetical protein WISP_141537 [Willisornis vidua]|uniref:Uncharacterized protein n=1 Tax=Willisornis vidua TaxID=1566151 RepID=A0ABQ9CLZ6_9PASS|nr:hypothetical protein WISP_141537 [Willisornis vidua]